MNIAVLGFGSLVNQPYSPVYNKQLEATKPDHAGVIPNGYHVSADSPFALAQGLKLPVRLARLSGEGTPNRRITAVLHHQASDEQVFYAKSKFTNLNEAIKNLREREGISESGYQNIGYVNLRSGASRAKLEGVAKRISDWARQNGYDAVVWTDLPAKGIPFGPQSTGREIMPLLQGDPVLLANTKQYIQNLPSPLNGLQRDILAMQEAPTNSASSAATDYQASLTADFAERDRMPQTNTPQSEWFKRRFGTWGPAAKKFPAPTVPQGVDPIQWKRDRIVEVAKHYTGLPYKRSDGMRGHFPQRGCGLDCSNFMAWVYNYGLGIQFSSDVDDLVRGASDTSKAGRKLGPNEPMQKGDLVFFDGDPKHVVMYIDEHHIIDSTSSRGEGVRVVDTRVEQKWCRPHRSNPRFLCVRRPIE